MTIMMMAVVVITCLTGYDLCNKETSEDVVADGNAEKML